MPWQYFCLAAKEAADRVAQENYQAALELLTAYGDPKCYVTLAAGGADDAAEAALVRAEAHAGLGMHRQAVKCCDLALGERTVRAATRMRAALRQARSHAALLKFGAARKSADVGLEVAEAVRAWHHTDAA